MLSFGESGCTVASAPGLTSPPVLRPAARSQGGGAAARRLRAEKIWPGV